jgi:hypothetical protein
MTNFKEWIKFEADSYVGQKYGGDDIFKIPLSNIWIMHWSVNPRKISTLDWVRNNYKDSFSRKLPQAFIGEPEGEFSEYHRLVDDEIYNDLANTYEIKYNESIPFDNNYPKVFLGDGTHRAIIALEKGEKFFDVKIENIKEFPNWKFKLSTFH